MSFEGVAYYEWIAKWDRKIIQGMRSISIPLLRISLGIVFLWFGILKFFPNLSPAEGLALKTFETLTFGVIPEGFAMKILATWECLIGIGFISCAFLRVTILLLALQMVGALSPLILFPEVTFTVFPLVPTLEGQYIIKNIVLIAGALVIGATVHRNVLQGTEAN